MALRDRTRAVEVSLHSASQPIIERYAVENNPVQAASGVGAGHGKARTVLAPGPVAVGMPAEDGEAHEPSSSVAFNRP